MRRHHDQPRIAHADEHHQHEIGRVVRRQRAVSRGQFIAVVAGRFVAMMPIGNEERLRTEGARKLRDEADIVNRPHPMNDAEVIGRFERGLPGNRLFEDRLGRSFADRDRGRKPDSGSPCRRVSEAGDPASVRTSSLRAGRSAPRRIARAGSGP